MSQLEREYDALRSAKIKLEAKLATTKQEEEELQALMDLARAKEISNKAMRSLDDLAGSGDADVARVADAVRARLDKASAESEMLASSLDKQMDEVLERGEIDAADRAQAPLGPCRRIGHVINVTPGWSFPT